MILVDFLKIRTSFFNCEFFIGKFNKIFKCIETWFLENFGCLKFLMAEFDGKLLKLKN